MRQRETELVQQLRLKEEQLQSSEALVNAVLSGTQRTEIQPGHLATASPYHMDPPTVKPILTVRCRRKNPAPCKMFRGTAAADHRFAYFAPHGSTEFYRCELSSEEWRLLPPCPYHDSGLVVVDGVLTSVGGQDGSGSTNQLLSLKHEEWLEEYPPMSTTCSSPAVVSSSGCIIAIAGGDIDMPASVERFHLGSRTWCKLANLPLPLPTPSATICGDQLHVMDDDRNGFSCSLAAIHSAQLMASPDRLQLSCWIPLPTLPVTWSTAATLNGELAIVGGLKDGSQVNSIHRLVGGEWVETNCMSVGRRRCLVVNPSPNKIIIVGGVDKDIVEECTISSN